MRTRENEWSVSDSKIISNCFATKKTENLLGLTVFIFNELILIETKNKYNVSGL